MDATSNAGAAGVWAKLAEVRIANRPETRELATDERR